MADLEHELTRIQRTHVMSFLNAGSSASEEAASLDFLSYTFLVHLQDHGLLRASDLAEKFRVTRATVSRHVARMVDHGYLQCLPDPEDGRATSLVLTDAGVAAITDYASRRQAVLDVLFANWSGTDRAEFTRLLRQFNDRVNEVYDDADKANPPANGMQRRSR